MVLSRILTAKPALHFHKLGTRSSARGCSSRSSNPKKEEPQLVNAGKVAKENSSLADQSPVRKECMEMNSKAFSGPEVQNKEGGSWFKGMVSSFKEKILGSPQSEKQTSSETSHPKVTSVASDIKRASSHEPKLEKSLDSPKSSEVPKEISDSSNTVKLDSGQWPSEETILNHDKKKEKQAEILLGLPSELPIESLGTMQKESANELASDGNGGLDLDSFLQVLDISPKGDKMPSPTCDSQKIKGTEGLASECSDASLSDAFFSYSDETAQCKKIRSLSEEKTTIKPQEVTMSNISGPISHKGASNEIQCPTENGRRESSLKKQEEGKKCVITNEAKEEKDKGKHNCVRYSRDESTENKVLLRFLHPSVENREIFDAFSDCGSILKVQEVSSFKGSKFKDAFVHFKTTGGLQKALKKNELLLNNNYTFVEANSLKDIADRISIPNLIGDPADIPVAMATHPTHTVKIMQLTKNVTSCQLKKALCYTGGDVTNLFFSSSSSVAYAEFKSEDAKVRALAKHSIYISGKKLPIFRVDSPRTTVVRIQNVDPNSLRKVQKICSSHGKLKCLKHRCENIVDVHFNIAEWPNMLNILNSLNGLEVDGRCWVAQPAPVIPPPILQVLWRNPDERKHVIAVMNKLLSNLQHPINTAKLTNLATYYADEEI